MFPGAGTAWNGRASDSAANEFDIGFNRGISTRVEDLAGTNGKNSCVGHRCRILKMEDLEKTSPCSDGKKIRLS
jgi:hypothetical protein